MELTHRHPNELLREAMDLLLENYRRRDRSRLAEGVPHAQSELSDKSA
jgi:hypothetical protein